MKPRLLVVTSVHPPDDPRIREKLIRTLTQDFEVAYAAQAPGPTDTDGLEWVELEGSRSKRRTAAGCLLADSLYDIAVVHDPELLPAARRAARRGRTVVFDTHENLPAQLAVRSSIPAFLRPMARLAAAWYLRRAETDLEVTLAEIGYRDLYARNHPVFENYPVMDALPAPGRNPSGAITYVGDVTEIRGAMTLVEAASRLEDKRGVEMIGRVSNELEKEISSLAEQLDVEVSLRGWMPHPEAMALVQQGAVGVSPLHDVPNYRRSLPTKTLEYLALGLPVVASDLPGTREVIGGLPGVQLVQSGDPEALAIGLEAALADEEGGQAASGVVRQQYGWPADRVRGFYGSLLREGSPEEEA